MKFTLFLKCVRTESKDGRRSVVFRRVDYFGINRREFHTQAFKVDANPNVSPSWKPSCSQRRTTAGESEGGGTTESTTQEGTIHQEAFTWSDLSNSKMDDSMWKMGRRRRRRSDG